MTHPHTPPSVPSHMGGDVRPGTEFLPGARPASSRLEQLREAGRRYVAKPDVKARRKAYDAKRYTEHREARKAQMREYSHRPAVKLRRKLRNAGLSPAEIAQAVARFTS